MAIKNLTAKTLRRQERQKKLNVVFWRVFLGVLAASLLLSGSH
jgi:choline-glycine betaine transporter